MQNTHVVKNILYIAIFTTFAVVSWIGLTIYHSYTKSTVSTDVTVKVTPIDESFDIDSLQTLKTRKTIPADLSQSIKVSSPSAAASPTPTPTLKPTLSITPSASIRPSITSAPSKL